MNNRNRVANRRVALLGSIIGGILIYLMPLGLSSGVHSGRMVMRHSIFFGNTDRWPSYMLSFGPLDLAATIFFFWLTLRLLFEGIPAIDSLVERGLRGWIMVVIGTFAGFGSLGGAIGATTFGWYASFEVFLMLGTAVIVLMGALGLMVGAMLGACFGIAYLAKRLWQHLQGEPSAQWFVQRLIRLYRYFGAEDIPEEKNPEAES